MENISLTPQCEYNQEEDLRKTVSLVVGEFRRSRTPLRLATTE